MEYIVNIATILNALFLVSMIFLERRRPETIVVWAILFAFVPIVGFVLYVLFGGGLSIKTKRLLRRKAFYDEKYQYYFREITNGDSIVKNKRISNIIQYNFISAKSLPTFNNKVKVFNDGKSKIQSLIRDLKKAKHSIHMEYYIFHDDFVGKEIMQILCDKAREGVKVKMIYDSVGCLRAPRRFFRQLKKAGGEVKEFFPPLFYIRLINLKMNYRNHRKIVVIDGKVGYVGGVNIRKDHIGYSKKLYPWVDTHLRVEGQAVYALQNTFLNFWEFCQKKKKETKDYVNEGYFPELKKQGDVTAQIITSGPDETSWHIRDSYVKLINSARKSIIIQTPYFTPDETFMNALKQAIKSGVKVILMLPKIPDKKVVYLASLSFAKEIVECGGEVYLRNGFLHSKVLIVDDLAMSIGTCNIDYRSFTLNFEVTAVIYNKELIQSQLQVIQHDIEESQHIDMVYYKNRPLFTKFGQVIFRLFAPIF